MDVPKSDLGDVIAWSLRGGRGGREGGGLIKATVMMKHFLFNESGGNHGRNGFYFIFLKKGSRSLTRCSAALTGRAAATPHANPSHLQTSRSHPLRNKQQPPPSGGVRRDQQPDQSQIFAPPFPGSCEITL